MRPTTRPSHGAGTRSPRPSPAASRPLLVAALVISAMLVGCRKDPPLEVGFARVDMSWRAGAKPGQVGTDALPDQPQRVSQLLQDLLPILMDGGEDPEWLLYELTEWTLGAIEEKTAELEWGRYAFDFEPGSGVELPPDVRAMIVRRGDEKVAIVRADVYLMHEQLLLRVAELVEKETGLSRDRIFLAGSHNHSAPHAISSAAGPWMMADSFDARHFAYVTRTIAAAIIEADAKLRPAVMRAGHTPFREVQMNIIGSSFESLTPPGGGEPVQVEVGYPRDHFDDDLTIIRFESPAGEDAGAEIAGEHLGSIFVLGMHPESLPSGHGITSGEWPIHVERKLEARHEGFFMWLPGALGDVEPDSGRLDDQHDFWRAGFEAMDRMSEIVADAVSAAWIETAGSPSSARPVVAQIARDVPGPSDYPMPDSTYLGGFRLPVPRVLGDSTTIRLHLVRLGDVLLAGIPAETVTDLSWNIKSRIGRGHDAVYQGYVFPGAPDWVRERIGANFSTDSLPEELRAKIPVVVNMTGGYVGYVVTRWEYENREHYRQSLTTFGPGTADHIAGAVVGLARELHGGAPFEAASQPWHRADEDGIAMIAAGLRSLDEEVERHYRELPSSTEEGIGSTSARLSADPVELTWVGGTNDLPVPSVVIEAEIDGDWTEVATGPGADVWILFEAPDLWTARWREPRPEEEMTFRIRVEGLFRSASPDPSRRVPLFDPDGANRDYAFVTEPFVLGPTP